jgi:hypothetical protein
MIILRAYREAGLAAREQGLFGAGVQRAVLQAAAKVATRLLGETVSPEDVHKIVGERG